MLSHLIPLCVLHVVARAAARCVLRHCDSFQGAQRWADIAVTCSGSSILQTKALGKQDATLTPVGCVDTSTVQVEDIEDTGDGGTEGTEDTWMRGSKDSIHLLSMTNVPSCQAMTELSGKDCRGTQAVV